MRLLIVEDDSLLAQGLKQGLRQMGYTVDIAASAEEAERFVSVEAFDLAVVDVGLPKADGLHFIRQLRNSGNHLPTLVLTARGGWRIPSVGWMPGPMTIWSSRIACRSWPRVFAP